MLFDALIDILSLPHITSRVSSLSFAALPDPFSLSLLQVISWHCFFTSYLFNNF